MGNLLGQLLGHGDQQPAWNIPLQQGNNNPNRPYSVQMHDMILHYGLPLMCIAMLEYQRQKNNEEKTKHLELLELEQKRYKAKKVVDEKPYSQMQSMEIIIRSLEMVEDKKLEKAMQELKIYDKGLEQVLDIKCSLFKDKNDRVHIQDQLINRLPNSEANVAVSYMDLKNIFDHDGKFCGNSKEENGRLRFLYAKQWQLELELRKYKNIIERLKEMKSYTKSN